MARRFPTLAAVEAALHDAGRPMRVAELVEVIGRRLMTRASNPQNVVRRDLSLDIRDNPDTRFERVAEGMYALRSAP